jgi:predicted nucleic acid-binding Zn ribbon protein
MDDDHHHCKVCGRVCATDQETCSKACRAKRDAALRSRKNLTYFLYAMIAFLVLLGAAAYLH